MGLLENLAQGFSNAAGDTNSANAIQKVKDDRRATQHEELEGKTNMILGDVKGIQDQLTNTPEGPDKEKLKQRLHDHMVAFQDLYHPIKNPGALAKLGGFLKQHIAGKEPAPPPQSNAVTPERMAGLSTPTYQNPFELKKRALVAAGVPEDEATRLATGQKDQKPPNVKYGLVPGTLNGQPLTLQHGADGTWKTMGNSEVDEATVNAFIPNTKASGTPLRVGSVGDFITRAYGPNPTPEQIIEGKAKFAAATAGSTVGEHVIEVPQPDGSIKAFTVQTESHKEFGQSVPSTPGEAKSRVAPHAHAGVVGGGQTVGGKLTSAQTDAQKKYYDAVKLSSQADQVAQHPEDAVNQKRLAVALERAAAGRFTTQALDYIRKAGWSAGVEQFWNNIDNGTLPADVMRQLIDGAHQNKIAAKAAMDEAMQGVNAAPATTQSSGKSVSLARAKLLPQNKGKSDDEIRKDIQAHGHQVAP